jgi:uncharacterized protein (TIGR01777 family)
METKHILITGGNGLIGKHLTLALQAQGHKVSHLSRTAAQTPNVITYLWNVAGQQIDEQCIEGVDTIIHLAGAGIADQPWTQERKHEIISSRTDSIRLIYKLLKGKPNQVKSVISASGIAYYGDRGEEILTEESLPAQNFLGRCCVQWEAAVDEGQLLGLRTVKFRTGVMLTAEGGALPAMAGPVRSGFGAPIGNGHQWVSWIHLQDVVGQYLMAVNSESMEGVFNQTAPEPVTNRIMTLAIARQFKKILWLPFIPAFVLKLMMGEMSQFVLGSTKAIPQAVSRQGYTFQYPNITDALKEIYK